MPIDRNTDRRTLLSLLIGGISAAVAGTITGIFGRFLVGSASAQEADAGAGVSLGRLSDWPGGRGPLERTISFAGRDGYFRDDHRAKIFLTRIGSDPVVFSATCTHLGCAVTWDPGSMTFRCPCHGGVYRSDGTVAAGPPPGPLRRLPIEIRKDEVLVHPGEIA